jgi:hypothetical protein
MILLYYLIFRMKKRTKIIYIVFTLIGIFFYFLNFFIINNKFSFGAIENKAIWQLDNTTQFIIRIIEPVGCYFNIFWFIITGIMIIVKSINNFNDISLLKMFSILCGAILIILALPIVALLYMIIYGAR